MSKRDPSSVVLTIIVPVYNERATVQLALDRLFKVDLPITSEIIVVDDGSTDGTRELLAPLVEAGSVRLISHRTNLGKGAAIRSGIGATSGDIVTVFDADLEYDPSDYVELLRPILEGEARVVYGTRSFRAHTAYSFWYVLGSRFVALWASFLFNSWLSDVETCFKLATTDLWRSLNLRSSGFGIEAEATAKFLRAGERIYEVPITYRARSREEGKKLSWTDGVVALWVLLRVRVSGRVTREP